MTFIIRHKDSGFYLLPPGQPHQWTSIERLARIFDTREEAQAECCPKTEVPVRFP